MEKFAQRHHYARDKRKSNTIGFYVVMTILMSALLSGFGIWAIVEFILYLAKDDPFNFTSLWISIIAFIGEIFFFLKVFLSE